MSDKAWFGSTYHDKFQTSDITNLGVDVAATGTPQFVVYEEANDTPIIAATNCVAVAGTTGGYRLSFTILAATGFELWKNYHYRVSLVVAGGNYSGFKKFCVYPPTSLEPYELERNIIWNGSTGAGSDGTHIVLDSTASSVDDIYNGYIVTKASTTYGVERGSIVDYVGSTRTATIDFTFTNIPPAGDFVTIYHTLGFSLSDAELSAFRAWCAFGINSSTGYLAANCIPEEAFAADTAKYQMKIGIHLDSGATSDRYTIAFFANSQPIFTGVTSPTLQVVKDADGTDLIAATSLTQIASTGVFKYTATGSARITPGAAYFAKVAATIDGSSRTWIQFIGRDS